MRVRDLEFFQEVPLAQGVLVQLHPLMSLEQVGDQVGLADAGCTEHAKEFVVSDEVADGDGHSFAEGNRGLWGFGFGRNIFIHQERMDDLIQQGVDLLAENDTLHQKVVKPIKRKALPFVITGVAFNLILLALLIYLVVKVSLLSKSLHGPL